MLQRFLDPAVLAGISGLDLVAKTVVDGFVNGLHRSPDFGFSQEFAEYRAYSPGDDLRHVDWNVFARTERAYLKRYRGETNSILTVLLDASNSMKFSSHSVSKMDYARFTAALMKPTSDQTWLLLTSAFHMPRSMGLFRKAGFLVTAFPIGYYSMGGAFDFPFNSGSAKSLLLFDIAVHEWIGLLVYYATGKIDDVFPAP